MFTRLPGQLAHLGILTRDGKFLCTTCHPSDVTFRMDDQLNTTPRLQVHWNALQNAGFYSGSPTEDENQGSSYIRPLRICDNRVIFFTGCRAPFSIWHSWYPEASCVFGLSSGGLIWCMGPDIRGLGPMHSCPRLGNPSAGMVGFPSNLPKFVVPSLQYQYNTVHGCFPVCVGSGAGQPRHQRPLVSSSAGESYQHSRDGGIHLCSQSVPQQIIWKSGPVDMQQCNNSVLHQTGRWDQII